MKATDLLIAEHKYILRALNVIEQMAVNVEHGRMPDDRDLEDVLQFLRLFADEHHQVKEEAVLFPAMSAATRAIPHGALRQMLYEHDQERSLVEGLEDALRTDKPKDFSYYAHRLNHILRTHIYKEDHVLFQMADECFSPEEDEQCACELAEFEKERKGKLLNGVLERLSGLEWKYLGKGASYSNVRSR